MGVYIKSSFSFLPCTFLYSKFSVIKMLFYNQKKIINTVFKDCNGWDCLQMQMIGSGNFGGTQVEPRLLGINAKEKILKCENYLEICNPISLSKGKNKKLLTGDMNGTGHRN